MNTLEQIRAYLEAGHEDLEQGSVYADHNRLLEELFNELIGLTCDELNGLLLQVKLARLMGDD